MQPQTRCWQVPTHQANVSAVQQVLAWICLQVVSLHSQLAVKQEEFADLAKLAEGLVADLEARASPSQDYI